MPTDEWLRKEFNYGYDSGDILAIEPDARRRSEELAIGGSYRRAFCEACLPFLREDSKVLELGPGKGSWSRAILRYIPRGELHTVDYQDVSPWLNPERYQGRLKCHRVSDNSFSAVPDHYFDFFWSIGVLCHNNAGDIASILRSSFNKLKPGGMAVHQYGDWLKLKKYGWERGTIPVEFQSLPDSKIWWPRNSKEVMRSLAERAGWKVISDDFNLFERDGLMILERPSSPSVNKNAPSENMLVDKAIRYINQGDVVEAIAILDAISRESTVIPNLHYLKAVAFAKAGLFSEANVAAEMQLQSLPGHQPTLEVLTALKATNAPL